MTRVKICGIRTLDDVAIVNDYKPDYIGFVFAESRRQVSLETAKILAENTDKAIRKVGVFVNQPVELAAKAFLCGAIDLIQLHGDEDSEYEKQLFAFLSENGVKNPEQRCVRAFRVRSEKDIAATENTACQTLLLDAYSESAYGGAGETFDWKLIKNVTKPFFLAGGINADNVQSAIKSVNPFAVDASSSLETDGKKDRKKIKNFIEKIKAD